MKAFSYARPRTTKQVAQLLGEHKGKAAILAGGTDLLSLMKDAVVEPSLLVSLSAIPELSGISREGEHIRVGATTTLTQLAVDTSIQSSYPALVQAVEGIASPQIRNMGTVGGDLCQRPRCWYFRRGYGLMAMHDGRSLVVDGDNRYHAILGNSGNARFVNPSSLAPALIAVDARVSIMGSSGSRELALAEFYRTPRRDTEREYVLADDEFVTGILLPGKPGANATYEVRQKSSLDWPLVAAAVDLHLDGSTVRSARVVLGHVAPVPWIASLAARQLEGKSVNEGLARAAGEAAVDGASALSMNAYKIQLARVAAKRAILRAAGMET